ASCCPATLQLLSRGAQSGVVRFSAMLAHFFGGKFCVHIFWLRAAYFGFCHHSSPATSALILRALSTSRPDGTPAQQAILLIHRTGISVQITSATCPLQLCCTPDPLRKSMPISWRGLAPTVISTSATTRTTQRL